MQKSKGAGTKNSQQNNTKWPSTSIPWSECTCPKRWYLGRIRSRTCVAKCLQPAWAPRGSLSSTPILRYYISIWILAYYVCILAYEYQYMRINTSTWITIYECDNLSSCMWELCTPILIISASCWCISIFGCLHVCVRVIAAWMWVHINTKNTNNRLY